VGVHVDGDAVEISVADQGIGIAADELDRVFERFYRVDQARSRNTGGSGLGLSIVKHTVQNHGGDVRVWSRPGRGSTFTIRLPLAEPPVTPTTDAAESASVPAAPAPVRPETPARIAAALPAAPARGDTE
jgi:two-component system sensor histidine kinase SenX3